MKKSIILFSLILFGISTVSNAQDDASPIQKGDYKILKLDALNLMGIGVQKLHLGYEISPMKQSKNNLPTVNFNLTVPFNSINYLDMNYGVEGGIELRFYQQRRHATSLAAEGIFIGVGIDGGYVSFDKEDEYYFTNGGGNKTSINQYSRVRTGIYFMLGAQTKLADKLYFDVNVGMGWSNVNVSELDPETDANLVKRNNIDSPFYSLYQDGKYQKFYMPVSFGLGYNFGNK
jgi:hypothetical protein